MKTKKYKILLLIIFIIIILFGYNRYNDDYLPIDIDKIKGRFLILLNSLFYLFIFFIIYMAYDETKTLKSKILRASLLTFSIFILSFYIYNKSITNCLLSINRVYSLEEIKKDFFVFNTSYNSGGIHKAEIIQMDNEQIHNIYEPFASAIYIKHQIGDTITLHMSKGILYTNFIKKITVGNTIYSK